MNISDCRKMQLWCLQRAKNDPAQSWKWLSEAERWRALGRSQSQQRQQAGPMRMGPYTINGDVRKKQQACQLFSTLVAKWEMQLGTNPRRARRWFEYA
jgi:hypothetical protein